MENDQIDYFRKREAQARAQAASAKDECARRVHLDLAERYGARMDDELRKAS